MQNAECRISDFVVPLTYTWRQRIAALQRWKHVSFRYLLEGGNPLPPQIAGNMRIFGRFWRAVILCRQEPKSAYPSFCILHSAFSHVAPRRPERASISGWPLGRRRGVSARSGQAMVELIVALIVIVLLLAGLIQIGQIAGAHTRTMIVARAEAAQAATADTYTQPAGANYIQTWIAGADGKCYTRDDLPLIITNPAADTQVIMDMAQGDDLAAWVPDNALSTLGMSPDTLDEFFLVRGYGSESCPILTAIQHLAYDQESIAVRSDAWLVWMEGIY